MRRFIILLCILLPSVMPEKLEKKHFIWSIKNEKNTIYLFGSYHVMKKTVIHFQKYLPKFIIVVMKFFLKQILLMFI